jgi:tRNA(fMet)-specific endonuclease VapC
VTTRFLLDTCIVSVPVTTRPNPEVMRQLGLHAHECAIGAPIWHELNFGVRRLPSGRRRTALQVYLEEVVHATFSILAYDEAAAAWHARERARLEQEGTPVPYVDAQIAAIARTNGLVLVTANARDFARFKHLAVQDWTRRKAVK